MADKTALEEGSGGDHTKSVAPPKITSAPLVEPAPGIAPPFTLNPIPDVAKGDTIETPDEVNVSTQGDVQSAAADNVAGNCPHETVWLRGPFGQARFAVEVAATRSDRAQGLMHVAYMPSSKGMLFVYDYPQEVAFWMKNTLIPLDILYADEQGVVTSIQANAVPGDLTPLPGGGLIQYVLEINGGLSAQLGIEPGAQLKHPAISTPIWPCE
ncbi:MAG: DUF192 domain-containing protein [Pelagimonas sp.]|uniref:DUF192 domain-containing protein n=1 Tax=Pelagimonas sp. TaxID=2073170 RepID=UPI003D6C2AED